MKGLERALVGAVLLGTGAIAYGAITQRSARLEKQERASEASAAELERIADEMAGLDEAPIGAADERSVVSPDEEPSVTALYSALPAPERNLDRIRFSLDARGASTYLPELLDARDGWNYRWPDRRNEPTRIWVQEPRVDAFEPAWTALVREAFSEWGDLGIPFFFTFTADSSRAQIIVTWEDRFSERMTGRTRWQHDQHGWIVGGNIQLALHLPDGRPVTSEGVRAIARHEVGHLLGLDHTADTTSVMAPQVFVTELSEADRRTIRLIYDLPPGQIRP